ncbi:MAG: hypothetical protein COA74_02615 [Gammaproteobacteria bacterium]|nr:MAG: hypothetical protein COA74_02615 [Gammaproteobacteria bacterium]
MEVETMIYEGLYLMLIGMGFVISFLTLLVLILNLLEKLVSNQATPELVTQNPEATLTAVITAAIKQHRQT